MVRKEKRTLIEMLEEEDDGTWTFDADLFGFEDEEDE